MIDPGKKYLITSALPYANGALHLGHLAGAYLPADIYVRYSRLLGADVLWVCGSDEHGVAITIQAKKEGVKPQDIIDKYHTLNKDTFARLGISFDYYHRTSAPLHHETSQDFFLKLYHKGDEFEARDTEQYYDEVYNQFLADRYIVGTCPRCGHPEAYGDQCENCGADLSPLELIEPRSTLSGQPPVLRHTKHWYFKLDKHAAWLREWIEKGILDGKPHHDPSQWKKHVLGQCLSWLDGGLQPRSITRDLDWGIPVPLDEAKGKVLYVWFDAPIGYISATRQWALENGEDWEAYWKSEQVELIHFIGKDNIVFHCVIFPAMLKAYGEFALPRNVPANQFLNFEGQKFSKSRGWGIEQHVYLEEFKAFPNKEDALRYTLVRDMPENRDSDFKWDNFVEYHDKELADNLGNFVHRVATLTHKYFAGEAPKPPKALAALFAPFLRLADELGAEIERFSFKGAAQSFMELSTQGNVYLQEAAPWALHKENPDDPRLAECMSVCLQIVALLSLLSEPFIPFTARKLRDLLGLEPIQPAALAEALRRLRHGEPLIPAGHRINQPQIIFAKINDRKDGSRREIVDRQRARLQAILAGQDQAHGNESMEKPSPSQKTAAAENKPKSLIQYEDFDKLDLRAGVVVSAERVPKADKLLKLAVDLGYEQRTVVSGIAEFFDPQDVVGRKVVLVANLAPRKIRGIESRGMILMAENAEGRLGFVSPPADWENGAMVR
jgi:methionyl-tRNA synthetase